MAVSTFTSAVKSEADSDCLIWTVQRFFATLIIAVKEVNLYFFKKYLEKIFMGVFVVN